MRGVALGPPMGEPIPYPAEPPVTRDDLPAEGAGSLPLVWPRVGARLLDELLWAIPMSLVLAIAALERTGSFDLTAEDVPAWALAVATIVPVLYEFACLSLWGATFGKWVLGLRVVRYVDGGRAAPYQAGLRTVIVSLGSLLGTAAAPLGDVQTLFLFVSPVLLFTVVEDALGRGWHDKGAGTIVVRAR